VVRTNDDGRGYIYAKDKTSETLYYCVFVLINVLINSVKSMRPVFMFFLILICERTTL
jgi:hypothetical protein